MLNRRTFIQCVAGASLATLASGCSHSGKWFTAMNPLPRWRGFNLLEMFQTSYPESVPTTQRLPKAFKEDDFKLISDWGFNFVRIPLSYYFWATPSDWAISDPPFLDISEQVLNVIDGAVALGQKYKIHVSLAMHRTPGYCVNPPVEPQSLWSDNGAALKASCSYWSVLAKRYRSIGNQHLSFDLLNEPPYPKDAPPTEFYTLFAGGAHDKTPMTYADYARFVKSVLAAIKEYSPERMVIAEGVGWATAVDPGLIPLKLPQSLHCYEPFGVAQYKAPAVGDIPFPPSAWPGGWNIDGTKWNRKTLEDFFMPFADLISKGIGVHCGEIGCYNRTPHDVTLAWLEDALSFFNEHGIGYALWQLYGEYGVADSGRTDVSYVRMANGRLLDEKMLKILQKY